MPFSKSIIPFILALAIAPALAQENETQADPASETENKEAGNSEAPPSKIEKKAPSADDTSTKKKPKKAKKSTDTFIPSEEISEDLSVSFPVDI